MRLLLVLILTLFTYPNSYANVDEKKVQVSFALKDGAVGNYLAAGFASQNNAVEEAADLYYQTLASNTNNPLLVQNAYKLMLLSGNIEKAIMLAKRFTELQQSSVSASLLETIYHLKRGDYKQANAELLKMSDVQHLRNEGIDATILPLLRVWTLVAIKDYTKAFSFIELFRKHAHNTKYLLYLEALVHDLAGNNELAKNAYAKLIEERNPKRYYIKAAANFYRRIGQTEKAIALYEAYRKDKNDFDIFLTDLGQARKGKLPKPYIHSPVDGIVEVFLESVRVLSKHDFQQEALAYIQIILYLKPEQDETLLFLANQRMGEGRHRNAISLLRKISPSSDFFWRAQISIAENWYKIGLISKAKRAFSRIAKRRPKNFHVYLNLGDLLRGQERYREAAAIYSRSINRVDELEAKFWSLMFARGICYEQSGRWEKAEIDLLEALELYPDQTDVLNYLGYSWVDRDVNQEKAIYMLRKALARRPTDPHIIDSMGWALYKQGKFATASRYLERAVEYLPYDPVINDHLGDTYWKLGRYIEARFQWKKSLDYGPGPLEPGVLTKKLAEGLPGGSG